MPELMPTTQECRCPYCEAPGKEVRWSGPLSMDIQQNRAAIHDCGTRTEVYTTWPEKEPSKHEDERSELCIARQRLFDDVLARCLAAPRIESFYGNNPEPAVDTHELWTVETAIVRARHAVADRYPLPSKGQADADHA